jgi:hypothetical protein
MLYWLCMTSEFNNLRVERANVLKPAGLVAGVVLFVLTAVGLGVVNLTTETEAAPTATTIAPSFGPTAGGTGFGVDYNASGRVTISGSGFMPEAVATDMVAHFDGKNNTGGGDSAHSGDTTTW